MRRAHLHWPLIGILALLAGCDGPRQTVMPRADAKHNTRVMQLKVVGVYKNDKLDYTTEFHVGYVIDVDVLDGPEQLRGQHLTLPYDDYYVAAPPPLVGDVVTVSPADWVTQHDPGKTRAFGE